VTHGASTSTGTPVKAASNAAKHGVTFEEAMTRAGANPLARSILDRRPRQRRGALGPRLWAGGPLVIFSSLCTLGVDVKRRPKRGPHYLGPHSDPERGRVSIAKSHEKTNTTSQRASRGQFYRG